MIRTRGNLSSARKPGLDARVAYELSKLIRSIPNITNGDQFPGRGSVAGDMHYYTGEDTTSYKKNNWYIRTTAVGEEWQSMNATSIVPENIQAGTIGSGVKIVDYLALIGGEMLGPIVFHEDQTFKPEMLSSGIIPASVSIAGYVPVTGGTYQGNLDLSDHSISSVQKLYGKDNLIFIDMGVDGILSLSADTKISLNATTIELIGAFNLTGDLAISGDLQVNGTDIGILTDTDLIKLALDLLTVNGALTVTGNLQVNGTNIGISTDTDLIVMALNLLTINGALNLMGDLTLEDTKKLLWSDVNLYRGAANQLKTDDTLVSANVKAGALIDQDVQAGAAPNLKGTNFTDYNIVCTDDEVVVFNGEVVYA